MTRAEKVIEEIKTQWFENHKATKYTYDNVTIIDWREPGSSFYSVRYIFSGYRLYISGDIGDAIFDLTWKATPESFRNINLGYLMGKLSCCSRDRWDFNEEKAQRELEEWRDERLYDAEDDSKFTNAMNELCEDIESAICEGSSSSYFKHLIWSVYERANGNYFDSEDFQMIQDFGKELPRVFYAYLLGIQMATKQLEEPTNT
ncbi:hypothetical protein [Paenibacillus sp. USHLN196]|uniref:hypothetical protein n=1 Tax=Paenibacillus sp. USHLN196 TaxID=3081291 RepID=UPI00301B6709